MKGIVFLLLEEIVRQDYGEETWDTLLEAADLSGAYTSLGSYPDTDLFKLVGAASAALKEPPETIVRWVGRRALPLLAERFPEFFTPHTATRPFVLTLNDIIHPEVRKIYPGADVPEFEFDTSSAAVLGMTYRSPRKMCAFAHGLIEGAAAFYGEQAVFEQSQCLHRGDPQCVFQISFYPVDRDGEGQPA